jgi:NO-binding membrane sensor protein with MHYT domain
MQVAYEPWLVLLSIVMAIQGAYVGFTVAVRLGEAIGVQRRVLLAGSAFSLAVAIWTMHFVGMLAARMSFPVDYLVFPTLLSLLVCVLVVGAAVFAISSGPLSLARLLLSACLMGVGIFSMHYIGMMALHASAHMEHALVYVGASLLIAIAASGLALWLATGQVRRPPLILSAIAFGIAVSGMHYTAMAGMKLFPTSMPSSGAPALSTDLLAIVVAVVAFCVSGIFLLVLVPDRSQAGTSSMGLLQAAGVPTAPVPAFAGNTDGNQAQFGRGTFAPLGGAGGPPPRMAIHLPVERDGATHFIAVEDVVAVHANAHYTFIFDGTQKLFCPLAIGEVESRLDKNRFARVHRSHIINVERVKGYRRNGDSEVVEMAVGDRYSVPVSRSRLTWLKSRVSVQSRQ